MNTNEILLYGIIGDGLLTAEAIKAQLARCSTDDELVVRIDSPGGSVFAGLSIFAAFDQHPGPKRCVIESAAFSIASYIAMAFDEIEIADNGYFMLHNPSVMADGDEEQLRRDAELLAKLKTSMVAAYSRRSGMPANRIIELMNAETFFDAGEAIAAGFATKTLGTPMQSRVVAMHSYFAPEAVTASLRCNPQSPTTTQDLTMTRPTARQIKAAFPKAPAAFVIRCLEDEKTMEEISSEMAAKLEEENAALKARVAELEEEVTALRAESEPLKEAVAKARAQGSTPVAGVTSGQSVTARDQWKNAVAGYIAKGMTKHKAVMAANRANPGLREALVTEANAR